MCIREEIAVMEEGRRGMWVIFRD